MCISSARRYCDRACWLVDWLVCLFVHRLFVTLIVIGRCICSSVIGLQVSIILGID